MLGIPGCFGSDIMHLAALNLPDLLINLWRGTLDCDVSDNRSTWDWAKLVGDTWQEHGRQVAAEPLIYLVLLTDHHAIQLKRSQVAIRLGSFFSIYLD